MSAVVRRRAWGKAVRLGVAVATGVAAWLVVTALVATAAPKRFFFHLRRNLSQTAGYNSVQPDLAVSPDGDRVAVVWTEGYHESVSWGSAYLRGACESTGSGWGNKIRIYRGDASACAVKAAVAVSGTTAHVAYIVFDSDCASPDEAQARYTTCSLVTGACADSEEVGDVAGPNWIIDVDLALDEEGNPHVVWTEWDDEDDEGVIKYRARAGSWLTETVVAESGENYEPAIAVADGYVYVTWRQPNDLFLRRRDADDYESWSWILPSYGYGATLIGKPDVAAWGGRVFVVYEECSFSPGPGECETFDLLYLRSNNRGDSWVGGVPHGIGAGYDSIEAGSVERPSYVTALRSSVVLNGDGWPAVVWHADRSSGGSGTDYAIYYRYAISGTDSGVSWAITPVVLNVYQPSMLGSAVVGVAGGEEDQHLHVAYMGKPWGQDDKWDVWYDSTPDEWDNYLHLFLPTTLRVYSGG